MIIFNKDNNVKCQICGEDKKGESTLIGVDGTQKGRIEQCIIVHVECLNLRYDSEKKLIYQILGE